MRASSHFGSTPPPSSNSNVRIASAADALTRMEMIATNDATKEVRVHASLLFREDVRTKGAVQQVLASRERHLKNEIAAARFRANQAELAIELDRFALERQHQQQEREKRARELKELKLAHTSERLQRRRHFFAVRKVQALSLMDLERARVQSEMHEHALLGTAETAADAQRRSVQLLLQREARAHVSPPTSPVVSPVGAVVAVRSPDALTSGRPGQMASEQQGEQSLALVRARTPLPNDDEHLHYQAGNSLPQMARPTTRRRADVASPGAMSPGASQQSRRGGQQNRARHMETHLAPLSDQQRRRAATPSTRPPTRQLSPTKHVALAKQDARQAVARIIAADAAAANERFRQEHRALRSLTPAAQLMAPRPASRVGTDDGGLMDAVGSQMVHAKQHARAWQRLFGRFEDALQHSYNNGPSPGQRAASPALGRSREARNGGRGNAAHRVDDDDYGDPVVTNESRPATRGGGSNLHRANGAASTEAHTDNGKGVSSEGEDFFRGGNFEPVVVETPPKSLRPSGAAKRGVGGDFDDDESSTDGDDLDDFAVSDNSDISDEALRRVIDGSSSQHTLASPPTPQQVKAARRLQDWFRAIVVHVNNRKAMVTARREEARCLAQGEAATRIQCSWRGHRVRLTKQRR